MFGQADMHRAIFLIFLTVFMVFVIPLLLSAQTTVAVGEFTNESNQMYLDQWERTVPDVLQEKLATSKNITVLERRKLKTILEEKALTLSGVTSSENAREIGELLDAQYIIFGTIHLVSGEYRIGASIVKVSSGQVHSEKVVAPDADHLSQMLDLLGNNILFNLTGQGKYKNRLQISHYPTGYFLAATAGLGLATIIVNSNYQKSLDEYQQNTRLDRFNELYDRANNNRKASVVLASLTGTAVLGTVYCWIRNRSPQQIYAGIDPKNRIIPFLAINHHNEVNFVLQIHF
jgi:TolB-like protein